MLICTRARGAALLLRIFEALAGLLVLNIAYRQPEHLHHCSIRRGALQRLEEDHDPQVNKLACSHPLSRYETTRQKEIERSEAPRNSSKPRSVLEEMAAANLVTTRIRVAYEKEVPADTLKFLSGDRKSKTVRRPG